MFKTHDRSVDDPVHVRRMCTAARALASALAALGSVALSLPAGELRHKGLARRSLLLLTDLEPYLSHDLVRSPPLSRLPRQRVQ
jgi:hypothetical protein